MSAAQRPKRSSELPPDPLPLPEGAERPGNPYPSSLLRDVCGPEPSPYADRWYAHRKTLLDPRGPVSAVHPELNDWIESVEGFDPRAQWQQKQLRLSAVIPRLDMSSAKFDLEPMSYVIDLENFTRRPGKMPSAESYRRLDKQLPEGSTPLLGFFSRRDLIDALPGIEGFWEHPMLDQFSAVLAPDFSVFTNDPIAQNLIGERTHQQFVAEGSDAGHTVIPSIAWTTEDSLARQVDLWASAYPQAKVIRFDALGHGVERVSWAWRHLFAIEKYLTGLDHIHWIFTGLTAGWQIGELRRILPQLNWSLIAPLAMQLSALRGGTDKKLRTRKFRSKIRQLQDLRAGRETADPQPRPERWPEPAFTIKRT